MLVSIIIPVYNTEKYLHKCIDSVLKQTYSNIEIILVDDGSTDSSRDICEQYLKKDTRIKVIYQQNMGQFSARLAGIKKATGEFLVFLDSDDEFRPDAIKIIVEKIHQTNCDLIVFEGSRDVNFSTSYMSIPLDSNKIYISDDLKEIYNLAVTTGKLNCMCMKAFKSELFSGFNDFSKFYSIRNGEDTLMAFMAIDSAKKICYINERLYYYRINEESISSKYNENKYNDSKVLGIKRREYSMRWLGEISKNVYSKNLYDCYNTMMQEITLSRDGVFVKNKRVEKILHDEFFKTSYAMADKRILPVKDRILLDLIMYLKMTIIISWVYKIRELIRKGINL